MIFRFEIRQARTAMGAVRACVPSFASAAALALLVLWPLAAPPAALGTPPTHAPRPDLSLEGFEKACGSAVDSEGNVYVASAGESRIRIFDSGRDELGAIVNANEPCGLAVAANGDLYVSEQGTGNVVRYEPSAFPFAPSPDYGPPAAIDPSGDARGIAVDPFDQRLYVAKGTHVDAYNSDGSLGIDEIQRVAVRMQATGGTYTLSFQGEQTAPLEYDASHEEVKAALEALATIGPGNVAVVEGPFQGARDHLITFTGALGETDVEALVPDFSALIGDTGVFAVETEGFSGRVGEGELTEATGVGAYTYGAGASANRYLFVADPAAAAADRLLIFGGRDIRALSPRRSIETFDHDSDPATPQQSFDFGGAGASIGTDPGTCPDAAPHDQACTAGHFFVYDAGQEAVDEFEASGEFLAQIPSPASPFSMEGAEPTAIAVDRSGGPNDGIVYVTSGATIGARVLAFDPLEAPSRRPRNDLSFPKEKVAAVAVDQAGNRYLSVDSTIYVYGPDGTEIPVEGSKGEDGVVAEQAIQDLAVDSQCNVYALDSGQGFLNEKFVYFKPDSCPPVPGTKYEAAVTVATRDTFPKGGQVNLFAVAVNPANDHVFVTNQGEVMELDSAEGGSDVLDGAFGSSLGLQGYREGIAVHGATGNVYVATGSNHGFIWVLDPSGSKLLTKIDGSGSPKGVFEADRGAVAVDQANGHVLYFNSERGVAEEYEPSGTFVTQYGSFDESVFRSGDIAVDNSGGPNDGVAYVAFFHRLNAFDELSYGEPPLASTGLASQLGGGEATLHGTVDPRGFPVTECRFQYVLEGDFQSEGFSGADEAQCDPDPAGIGLGLEAVPVQAEIANLNLEQRYRFRLLAENKYGTSDGGTGVFGPPLFTTRAAQPISYTEATLRATVDPSGLATKYRFEYGTTETYGQSTATAVLPAAGPDEIAVPAFGLTPGTRYHFRLVLENEAKTVKGPDQTIETLERLSAAFCPNEEYRTGRSAALPDCRAYELVTPAETRGLTPIASSSPFNSWRVTPHGEGAGNRLTFATGGTLPGFEGSGRLDGYLAKRAEHEGPHPRQGWRTELVSHSYVEAGGGVPEPLGIASDQRHAFWDVNPLEALEGRVEGLRLRTPAGFESEPAGRGSLGADPEASPRYLAAGGAHVIFTSAERLEPEAPPAGTEAIYDRDPSGTEVVSVKPDGSPFGAGQGASYLGGTEDGSTVAFKVDGALYVWRESRGVLKVADSPNTFAGVSEDSSRVFYADAVWPELAPSPASLHAFDLETESTTPIAPDSIFVNVSTDGSHVFFTSTEVLDDAGEGSESENNLYVWNGEEVHLVAILDGDDLSGFEGTNANLLRWAEAIGWTNGSPARAESPTRSTPDGTVLVFQSHAQLTAYENGGFSEIYRYDATTGEVTCVSCDPSGLPPSADDSLQTVGVASRVAATTLIPNVTDDGRSVFFQSDDQLLPEDANRVKDVYHWKAQGVGGCRRAAGCLVLISSGQSENASYLYSMTPDGHDVFFRTTETLHGMDVAGSPSIYDARIGGGIPNPAVPPTCEGDGCKAGSSPAPALPVPGAETRRVGKVSRPGRPRCRKGKRRVVRRGKARCVRKRQGKRRNHRRQKAKRQAR